MLKKLGHFFFQNNEDVYDIFFKTQGDYVSEIFRKRIREMSGTTLDVKSSISLENI